MNTSEIKAQKIIEQIIRTHLQNGEVPSLEQIEEEFNLIIEDQDLNSSNFTFEEWKISRKEESSAAKQNEMNTELVDDIDVLYKNLFGNSQRAIELFSRWQLKATSLENRLRELESRIERQLDISNQTTFFDSLGDKFTDTKLVDQDRSSGVLFDLNHNIVTLNKEVPFKAGVVDRIFLNELRPDQAIFTSVTRTNVISSSNVDGTEPRFAFRDVNQFWKNHVSTSKKVPSVITEVLLSLDEPVSLSSLDLFLHSSQSNSVTRVTPLYSKDGASFSLLPTELTTLEGLDKLSFKFSEIEFSFLKIVFEKKTHDFVSDNLFVYEFGAREIALFNSVFSNTTGTVISKPLSIVKENKELSRFNKISLNVCEVVPEDTNLDYYIAVGKETADKQPLWLTTEGLSEDIDNDSDEDQRLWFPISPLGRVSPTHPTLLDFTSVSVNRKEDIGISFDREASTLISPAADFNLLILDGNEIVTETKTATDQRYFFGKPSHHLLDTQIDSDINVNLENLSLWRNVGEKGIGLFDTTKKVRGIQAGWEFRAPYYYTTVLIESSDGLTIDVGNNPIFIDEIQYTKVIDDSVLFQGIHTIKVHQDFWGEVEPGLSSLADLKSKDILYPFNQKLLIEGYLYDSAYPSKEEKIYEGVDRFASYLSEKVSIFDMISSVSESDLSKFALDSDVSETTPDGVSRVFVVNINKNFADFMNEKFMLEFHLTDDLFSFLAFKAELKTEDTKLTPVLDEYAVKLSF